MSRFFYAFLILPISLLPLQVLYFLSNLLFVLSFYGFGYRKKVVLENLHLAFPERSESERNQIARDFYRHFCDLVFESFKGFTLSEKEALRRFTVENPELLNSYFERGESVILTGGHYANWEWFAFGLPKRVQMPVAAIYKPLSNRFFDAKVRRSRERFGLRLLPIREVPSFFSSLDRPWTVSFLIDQSPGDPKKAHWLPFLGKEAGVSYGAEKYARELGLSVLYGRFEKPRRGYYTLRFEVIAERPSDYESSPEGWILEEASRRLEAQIRERPELWLWTHRRWKHGKPEN